MTRAHRQLSWVSPADPGREPGLLTAADGAPARVHRRYGITIRRRNGTLQPGERLRLRMPRCYVFVRRNTNRSRPQEMAAWKPHPLADIDWQRRPGSANSFRRIGKSAPQDRPRTGRGASCEPVAHDAGRGRQRWCPGVGDSGADSKRAHLNNGYMWVSLMLHEALPRVLTRAWPLGGSRCLVARLLIKDKQFGVGGSSPMWISGQVSSFRTAGMQR